MFPKSLNLTTITWREALKQTAVVLACCALCGVIVGAADFVFTNLVALASGLH